MTMGDMGTVGVSKGGGFNVNGAYDETYPRAYEENSDAGGQSSLNSQETGQMITQSSTKSCY